MKKVLNCFIVIFVVLFLTLSLTTVSFAQEEGTQSAKVEYNLPFAGMLPDSPLYFIKTFRDKLISIFISDPLKKAEFDLLQADKRLASAILLFERGKKDLAESTISKGENYFDDGIKSIELAKKQGRDVEGLLINFDLSAKKHLEILSDLKTKTDGNLLEKFAVLEKRMLDLESQVERIKLQ